MIAESQAIRSIAHLSLDPKILNRISFVIDRYTKQIQNLNVRWNSIDNVEEITTERNFDLLIASTHDASSGRALRVTEQFEKQMRRQGLIWVPTIFISEMDHGELKEIFHYTLDSNWYFDIVHPDQLESLPIRIANLIRLHDHLKEIFRYDQTVRTLEAQVLELSQKIEKLKESS